MTAAFVLAGTLGAAPASADETARAARFGVAVTDLTVNGRAGDQLGIGDTTPTLTWRMSADAAPGNPCFDDAAKGQCALDKQTAYEVQVATSLDRLERKRLLWQTGRVSSDEQTVDLGVELAARDSVFWRVRVWDANRRASEWSEPSKITIGLLEASDWTAQWIEDPEYRYQTDGEPNPLPIFATRFDVEKEVASASLYATGLGQYAATINGSPIGDAVLEPGQTSYWNEVNYRTYDVTGLLAGGGNVIGFEVGSGVYQQADTTSMQRYNFQPEHKEVMGTPKVRAQLEISYTDGSVQTVATDDSWRARSGPTVFSSWWGGEDYDGRILRTGWTGDAASLDGEAWHASAVSVLDGATIPRDTTPLVADPRPPVTVVEEVQPVSITPQQPAAVTTAVAATAGAGSDNVKLATMTGIFAGDTIDIAGQSHTITSVGIAAKTPTTLTAAAAAGATTISVANLAIACYRGAVCEGSAGFVVGQPVVIGSGTASETVTVTGVTRTGTGNNSPGDVTVSPALQASHEVGAVARGAGTGITITPALPGDVVEGTAVVTAPRPAYVLDYGRNLVGLLKVTGEAPAGTTVSLLGSEQPAPPTNLDTVTNAGIYRYTFAGTGTETWHAQFTYNGQRYLVVRGMPTAPTPETVTLLVTHAANEQTSTFETCDDMLNSIYGISKRALEGNMLSVLTDCPNREKGPYTGDNLHNIDFELTAFDMRAYQGQLVANMRTSQRPTPISEQRQPGKYEGMIANIAPEFHAVPDAIYNNRWFLDEPNWGGAVVRIPWALYQVYGDDSAMAPNYDAMVKWLEYTKRSKETNPRGEINGLGDWSAGQATVPAEAIIDIGYYEGAHVLSLVAAHLGKTEDAEKYAALAEDIKREYNEDYLNVDEATGRVWYANDTQASNAVALHSDLVPEEHREAVFASLVRAVETFNYRLSHGSVAGEAVFEVLRDGGRDDLLYRMVVNPESPSYAFQVLRGQTTLAEGLNGRSSQNHHFLGQVGSWMVHDMVGIDQKPGTIAYRQLEIKPAIGEGIDSLPCVSASYTTPAGLSAAKVTRSEGRLDMEVTVPANTSAEVWVPRADGQDVLAPRRADFVRDEGGYAVYAVGAGTFSFAAGSDVLPEVGKGEVRVQGDPVVGKTLRASSSGWSPRSAQLTYQWLRDGVPIEGATGRTYAVASADVGKRLSVTVTGAAPGYRPASVTSDSTAVVVSKKRPEVSLAQPTGAGPFRQLDVRLDATADNGLTRIVANIYRGGTLVKSTQTPFSGEQVGTHLATVQLPEGSYSLRYNAQDSTGRLSQTREHSFSIDTTPPTVSVKEGRRDTAGTGGSYSFVSFKLYDKEKIDKLSLNGVEKNLTDNAWSDLNGVKPGVFGAALGTNTLVVYDVAGNTTTVVFTLVESTG